jgi:virginiamycin B lyase
VKQGFQRSAAALLAGALLAACGGANQHGANLIPGAGQGANASPDRKSHKPVKGYLRFIIPPMRRGHRSHFVSGATLGAKIVADGGTTKITTIANLAPLSTNCTGTTSRQCTIASLVPLGNNVTITVTTYDASPVHGTIPANADTLAIGSVSQPVVAGVTPSIPVYLGGVIGSIGLETSFASLPADGTTQHVMLALTPQDFGNQTIKTGTKDPYNNPISVTLNENGGSGHSVLVLNGNASGQSATISQASDTIVLRYDGGGNTGYNAKISFAASGAPTQKAQFSPMFVSSASSMYVGGRLILEGSQVMAPVNVSEAGTIPGTQSYSAQKAGCGGPIATVTTVTNTPANAQFDVTGGGTASPSGCSIAFLDGFGSSISVDASNTLSSGGNTITGTTSVPLVIPQPAFSMSPYPEGVVAGPNQNLAIADAAGYVDYYDLSGTVGGFTFQGLSAAPSTLTGIVAGPDGAIWVSDTTSRGIWHTANGASVIYPVTGNQPGQIVDGADGNMYFADASGGQLDELTVGGAIVYDVSEASSAPVGVAMGPDDAIWYTEPASGKVARYDLSSQVTSELTTGGTPLGIAAGSDGAMWYTDQTGNLVGRIPTTQPYAVANTYPTAGFVTSPSTIAQGPDAGLWFASSLAGTKVGRVDVATGTVTTISYPGGGVGPVGGITAGPDDNVYYTLYGSSMLVEIALSPTPTMRRAHAKRFSRTH